jgi:hypothetical protein
MTTYYSNAIDPDIAAPASFDRGMHFTDRDADGRLFTAPYRWRPRRASRS